MDAGEEQQAVLAALAAVVAPPRTAHLNPLARAVATVARVQALAWALSRAGKPEVKHHSSPVSFHLAVRLGSAAELWAEYDLGTHGDHGTRQLRRVVVRLPGTGWSVQLRRARARVLLRVLADAV